MRKLAFIALVAFLTVSFAALAHADIKLTKPSETVTIKDLGDLLRPDALKISRSGENGPREASWAYNDFNFEGTVPGVREFQTVVFNPKGNDNPLLVDEGVFSIVLYQTWVDCEDVTAKEQKQYSFTKSILVTIRLSNLFADTREKLLPYLVPQTIKGYIHGEAVVLRGNELHLVIYPK